ncbi:hypothetical protein [Halothiobacillus sp.]|uniref:hypothetical protein n=1 Tax=Halothiobacillus sp. TaxID=1891311 RepID=UPI002AD26944|nr:hypothetical protein [Halothiobacillus sp.]
MTTTLLTALANWSLFVLFGVSLVLLIKSLNLLMQGMVRTSLLYFAGLVAWVLFSLLLVFTVILNSMNHAAHHLAAAAVYVITLAYALAGVGILIMVFRPRRNNHTE